MVVAVECRMNIHVCFRKVVYSLDVRRYIINY